MKCKICGRKSGNYRGVPVCMSAYAQGVLVEIEGQPEDDSLVFLGWAEDATNVGIYIPREYRCPPRSADPETAYPMLMVTAQMVLDHTGRQPTDYQLEQIADRLGENYQELLLGIDLPIIVEAVMGGE